MFCSSVNSNIRELRKENGLTQAEVANVLGIDQRTYSRYEQLGYSVNIRVLASLAIFYNVSIDCISGYFPDYRKSFFYPGCQTFVNGFSLFEMRKEKIKKNKIRK